MSRYQLALPFCSSIYILYILYDSGDDDVKAMIYSCTKIGKIGEMLEDGVCIAIGE